MGKTKIKEIKCEFENVDAKCEKIFFELLFMSSIIFGMYWGIATKYSISTLTGNRHWVSAVSGSLYVMDLKKKYVS